MRKTWFLFFCNCRAALLQQLLAVECAVIAKGVAQVVMEDKGTSNEDTQRYLQLYTAAPVY